MAKVTSAGALIFHLGKMLIVLDRVDAKFWNLPKGHIEEGETPWDTALREVWEETNIVIKGPGISEPEDLGLHKYLPKKKDLHLFKVEMPQDWEPDLKCNSTYGKNDTLEVVGFQWIDPKEYTKYFSPNLIRVMKEAGF